MCATTTEHDRAITVAVTCCALLLAACGSGSPANSSLQSAAGSNSSQAQIHNQSLRFARCMRATNVPTFPDPPGNGSYGVKSLARQSNGNTISINGVSVNTPAFRTAMAKCQQYLPSSPAPPTASQLTTIRALAVTWAKCMRGHGLPRFGDPTITADGRRTMHGEFDIGSPAYYAARRACDPGLNRSMAAAGFSER